MKNLFFISIFFGTLISNAKQNIIDTKGSFQLCQKGPHGEIRMGCAQHVLLKGKKMGELYVIDEEADQETKKSLPSFIGSFEFHNFASTPAVELRGFEIKEKGHFPNPMVEFTVFHILRAETGHIPVPKSMPRQ